MRKVKRSPVLSESMIDKAAKYFLTSEQNIKNKNMDLIFEEQPSLINYIKYLDEAHEKEVNKEIIIQIVSIMFIALRFQKIKLKKIKFSKIRKALEQNVEMKNYFNNPKFEFDEFGFKEFWRDYKQKNILSYTYFAINEQYAQAVEEERDAVFIFYTVKSIADTISDSAK